MGTIPTLPLFTGGPAKSGQWNRVRDVVAIWQNAPRCRAYLTTDTNITTATETTLDLAGETFDVVLSGDTPAHDTVTNPSRIYARVTGYYRITAQITWKSNATTSGNRGTFLYKNGTTLLAEGYTLGSSTASTSSQIQGAEFFLTAGDYVTMVAYQSSGVTQAVWGTTTLTFLQATLVGASSTTSGQEATNLQSALAEMDLGTTDLDTVKAPGNYVQGTAANATLARHYPVATVTGHLEVLADGTLTPALVEQRFVVSSTNDIYVRTFSAAAWSAWEIVAGAAGGNRNWVPATWCLPGENLKATTSNESTTLNTLYVVPFYVAGPGTVTDLAINVQTAAGAGNLARLGIYKQDASGAGWTLVNDAGTVAIDTTGQKTLSALTIALGSAGLYGIAVLPQATITLTCQGADIGFSGLQTPFSTSARVFLSAAVTYGALPATASPVPGGGFSSAFHRALLKLA